MCLLLQASPGVEAQTLRLAPTVTILSSGSAPDTRETRALAELSKVALSSAGLRILTIEGRGAVENVNDLMFLRGVDIAVIANDIFEFLRIERAPLEFEARRKVRALVPLADNVIYVLAKHPIRQWTDLRGKSVGTRSLDGAIAARVMFATAKTDVRHVSLSDVPSNPQTLDSVDALVLIGDELQRQQVAGTGLRLVPIPEDSPLLGLYKSVVIPGDQIRDLSEGRAVRVLQRTSVLATFVWPTNSPRYSGIRSFITAFYGSIDELRSGPRSPWRSIDVGALPPGIPRYAPAEPRLNMATNQLPTLAAIEEGSRPIPEVALDAAPSRSVSVLAGMRSPLADPRLPHGGLAFALLGQALKLAPGDWRLNLTWQAADGGMVDPTRAIVSGPWIGVECESVALAGETSMLCDHKQLSAPILHIGYAFYGKPQPGDVDAERTRICHVPVRGETTPYLDLRRTSDRRFEEVRRMSVVECVIAVENNDADAFVAIDFEVAPILRRLGLAGTIRPLSKATATRAVQFAVDKSAENSLAIIDRINLGIERLKQSGDYIDLIANYVASAQTDGPLQQSTER